jgi:hypothetical protein
VDDDAVKAVVYKGEQIAKQPGEEFHRNSLYTAGGKSVGRKTIKRRPGKRHIEGKDFHLADEIQYIQRRAAERDGRFVTVGPPALFSTDTGEGPLALFSTDTGDAWLLDSQDHLAARLARDGDPEELNFEETDTRFAIDWKGQYRIDADTFVYIDKDTGRIFSILGYPIRRDKGPRRRMEVRVFDYTRLVTCDGPWRSDTRGA